MVRVGAAVIAGSVALLGFDSGTEALASIIVIWRFTGTRLTQRHLRAPRATAGRGQLLPARPLHRHRGHPRHGQRRSHEARHELYSGPCATASANRAPSASDGTRKTAIAPPCSTTQSPTPSAARNRRHPCSLMADFRVQGIYSPALMRALTRPGRDGGPAFTGSDYHASSIEIARKRARPQAAAKPPVRSWNRY